MLRFAVALCGALVLTGCYTSPVPLSTIEQAEFDPRLLGTWYEAEPVSADDRSELVITRAGEREYDVHWTSRVPFSTSRATERARGHVVRVDGVPFLNLRGGENDSEWIFFRYDAVAPDGLRLRSLSEDIDVPPGPSGLREFVRRNLNRPEIYTEPVVFRQKK